MKFLLAGGAGFIGSHLAEELVSQGNNVDILDNFSSGLDKNIEAIKSKIKVIKRDVTSFSTEEIYDFVLNFASRASRAEWESYPVEVALSNSVGSINLIKVALTCGALYVFASSSEIYGDASVIPTPEHYLGSVSTTGSRSPYDEGKRFGEAITKAFERQYGLRNIILRIFNTYGPRMRGDNSYGRVVDRFLKQAVENRPITVYGDGSQTRSFTYVSDTVKAIKAAIEKGKEGEVYNIGNDKEIKVIELAEMMKSITKSNSQIVFGKLPEGDPKRRAADISKIAKLGWSPSTSINDGIQKVLEFHKGDETE
jgi:UDP-glucuronate decarboxylase